MGVLKIDEDFDIDDDCIREEGCFGKQIFNIVGIQKGKSKVVFKYSNQRDVRYTRVYNITVSEELYLSDSN